MYFGLLMQSNIIYNNAITLIIVHQSEPWISKAGDPCRLSMTLANNVAVAPPVSICLSKKNPVTHLPMNNQYGSAINLLRVLKTNNYV